MQLFALYNHTGEMDASPRFYSLRVPLLVQREAGLITDVDTHWLDHMTQHFTSGAHLVDGFFHLRDEIGKSENKTFCKLTEKDAQIIRLFTYIISYGCMDYRPFKESSSSFTGSTSLLARGNCYSGCRALLLDNWCSASTDGP